MMIFAIQRKYDISWIKTPSALGFLCTILLLASPRVSFAFSTSFPPSRTKPTTTHAVHDDDGGDDGIVERVFAADDRPVMLFDGECNLCNGAVNQMIDWDPDGRLRFAALQSRVGRALLQAHGRRADDTSSIVVVTRDDGALIRSDAVLRLVEELDPPPSPWIGIVKAGLSSMPRAIRDVLFHAVYGNRYHIMGRRDECRLDFDGEFDDRFVDDALAGGN